MKEVYGSTTEEVRLCKSIQRGMEILDNGFIGTDTLTSIAERFGADCFPLAVKMYGCPTVVAKSCIPFSPWQKHKIGISKYAYTMSGSFTEPRNEIPCSICINGEQVIREYSCHYWTDGKPESVIYQTEDGKLGIRRCVTIAQLPQKVKWAVGGMGLGKNYDPIAEGFTGKNADVLRRCGHTVLGYKNGYVYGVCFTNYTTEEIQKVVTNKFMFDGAIQLDGGSIYYYNFPGFTRDINKKCGFAIQFV